MRIERTVEPTLRLTLTLTVQEAQELKEVLTTGSLQRDGKVYMDMLDVVDTLYAFTVNNIKG